jgi:beta-phosphoglucomutase-like phosphatase (HAD superfamily)/CTP:phosphocholine cytidylyltransferase-like protein
MNIIIPLAGKGERFLKEGYTVPKPIIQVFHKTMLEYVIDHLSIESTNHKVFIFYREDLNHFHFEEYYKGKYPTICFIQVPETKGASETLYKGIQKIFDLQIEFFQKTLVIDCDTFYTTDIISHFNKCNDNMVFCTKKENEKPIYSYIQFDQEKKIHNIVEKEKISDYANTGAYAFANIHDLHQYCKYILDNNITFRNEPYTSCVIAQMIKENHIFKSCVLKENDVVVVGTPQQLKEYKDRTYAFLFDLDGTIVNTDEIYYQVWMELLEPYYITLTKEMYKNEIQGNSDETVVFHRFHLNVSLKEFSEKKDSLFLQNIQHIEVIHSIEKLFQTIYQEGHLCCIVTNCNKKVAKWIIEHLDFGKWIDFIISVDDCIKGKPSPEPYLKAIKRYQISADHCFIFEDSKSGLLSALSTHPKMIIGIESNYSSETLLNIGAHMTIPNYQDIDIQTLLSFQNNTIHKIKQEIHNSIQFMYPSNSTICLNETNLKGGFIANVMAFEVGGDSLILKYESNQKNNLLDMAKRLKLCEREYYFYQHISKYVKYFMKVPRYVNIVYDDQLKETGIILENLFHKGKMEVNLNLNEISIDVSLKIIDRMAKMHSYFWNKDLKRIFPKLQKSTDELFCPFFETFISEKYPIFEEKWKHIFTSHQLQQFQYIASHFTQIQNEISEKNITFIHGDIKSPNIFYDTENNNEPYFLDWQHCAIGKGTQDFIFFLIESFDIEKIPHYYLLFQHYYYQKLKEHGIKNYEWNDYQNDLRNAIFYIPFFTAVWFGSLPYDDLIDKNWPFFFIKKYCTLLNLISI